MFFLHQCYLVIKALISLAYNYKSLIITVVMKDYNQFIELAVSFLLLL